MCRWLTCFLPLLLISSLSFTQDVAKPSHHVAGNMPVSSSRIQLTADRASAPHAIAQPNANGPEVPGNTWQCLPRYQE